jgi:hypothetical protein
MACAQWSDSLLMSYILNAVNSGVSRILPTRLPNLPPESSVLRKCLTNPVQCLHVVYRSRNNCLFKHAVRRGRHLEVCPDHNTWSFIVKRFSRSSSQDVHNETISKHSYYGSDLSSQQGGRRHVRGQSDS